MRQNRNLTLFYTECMENMLVDKKTRALVSEYVPPAETLTALADLFSLLSDAGRLKIVSALSISSLCVSDLSTLIGMNQTTLSHQLTALRRQNIVDKRRQGKVSFYYIKNKAVLDIMLSATSFV